MPVEGLLLSKLRFGIGNGQLAIGKRSLMEFDSEYVINNSPHNILNSRKSAQFVTIGFSAEDGGFVDRFFCVICTLFNSRLEWHTSSTDSLNSCMGRLTRRRYILI